MKPCTACDMVKPLCEFHKHGPSKDGRLPRCASCVSAYNKANYQRHKDKIKAASRAYARLNRPRYKDTQLMRDFGITLADWQEMFSSQHGKCAVCLKNLDGGKFTHVDHDHVTGKVRSLLCSPCNSSLGLMKESFEAVLNLAKYIQTHKEVS